MKTILHKICLSGALLTAALLFAGQPEGLAQGTAFTYQGRLDANGAAASCTYDLQFGLWNAASGPSQLGTPVTSLATPVVRGLFTVTLDFGASFPGDDRWLEIAVRTNGAAAFSTLSPRQRVTPSPYAITAGKVTGGVPASQIVGTVPLAQLPSGFAFASADPSDPQAQAAGLRLISKTPAPAWANGSASEVPSARIGHSSVWTGHELIIWGGALGTIAGAGQYSASGGWYQPDADVWTAVSTLAAPGARRGQTAIWSGSEMIVWGGFSGTEYLATGGRFSLASQSWHGLSVSPLAPREGHVSIWTGNRMLIWGGRNDTSTLGDGALYNPGTGVWTPLPTSGAPGPRAGAAAVWTGDRLLVWGGEGDTGYLGDGAQLRFINGTPLNAWQTISAAAAPGARGGHTAVWSGSRMIVWGGVNSGGQIGNGAAYDPLTDKWTPLTSTGAPEPREQHNAVWTGSEMIVYGGLTASGATASGAAYDPASGLWRALSNPGAPQARSAASAVWTGSEALFFGGRNEAGAPLAALQRLNPQPAWYFFRKP